MNNWELNWCNAHQIEDQCEWEKTHPKPWPSPELKAAITRQFETGATRDNDSQKLDYEGFLSPVVLECFAEYMHRCRLRNVPEGQTVRSSDNWQKGIPIDAYMKSMLRHVVEFWKLHRGVPLTPKGEADREEALCATLFNVQGYLFELLKAKHGRRDIAGSSEAKVPRLQQSVGIDSKRQNVLNMSSEVDSDATGHSAGVDSASFPCPDY